MSKSENELEIFISWKQIINSGWHSSSKIKIIIRKKNLSLMFTNIFIIKKILKFNKYENEYNDKSNVYT